MEDSREPQTKRAQIVSAAVETFQEMGFAQATMDEISARAQVSKRTLYKYFESKENLFHTIAEELGERFNRSLSIPFSPDKDMRVQLTELARAEGALLTAPDVMAACRMFVGEAFRSPEVAEAMQEKATRMPAITAFIAEAAEHGALVLDDPEAAGEEFLALMKAKAFWPVVFGAPVVSDEVMEGIVQSCVDMMMARYGA